MVNQVPKTQPRKQVVVVDASNDEILRSIADLREVVSDFHVALRGAGDKTGYLARVERLEDKMGRFINGDFAKLKQEILDAIDNVKSTLELEINSVAAQLRTENTSCAKDIRTEFDGKMAKTVQWPKVAAAILPTILSIVNAILIAWAISRFGP